MGLLTDPSTGKGKLTKLLLKYHNKISVLLLTAGIISFWSLAHPSLNASTYFSENALLPGLVKSQFREESNAGQYLEELNDEMKKYDNSIPYPWLLGKFRQFGLDTYTHNFSITSPLTKTEHYVGKNVYAILRSPRGSSTESLVLSVPYRPPNSVYPSTAPSIAIMLAFAKYAIKEKYWAKDLIFLITEHEQLGIQAWLEAYYGVTCGDEGILHHGDLKGRGGAIQAAINLELHSDKIAQMDIKIEGLNGQLPNLDLFNLVSKMCSKEGLYHTFKNRVSIYTRDPIKEWWNYFTNLIAMMTTQATGIPNGNHGLFHRFGVQAVTLEGYEYSKTRGTGTVKFVTMGRILEGIFRSLNNLLERFHQSFFFYLLPSSDRYISIGVYIPSVCLIAGTLFVKACAKWLKLQDHDDESETQSGIPLQPKQKPDTKIEQVLILFFLAHAFGLILSYSPHYISSICESRDCQATDLVFYVIFGSTIMLIFLPVMIPLCKYEDAMNTLNILSSLELGTTLICLSMTNFSLGIFCALMTVPTALMVRPTTCRVRSLFQKCAWLLAHPAVILMGVLTLNVILMFPELTFKEVANRVWQVTENAVVYSITDSMIYGNWLFTVVTCIFIPNWLCLWIVSFGKCKNVTPIKQKKE